jgi:hypothetical protein
MKLEGFYFKSSHSGLDPESILIPEQMWAPDQVRGDGYLIPDTHDLIPDDLISDTHEA